MKRTRNSEGISPWTWRITETKAKCPSSPFQIQLYQNANELKKSSNYSSIYTNNMLIRNKILSNHINLEEMPSKKIDLFHKRETVSLKYTMFQPEFNQPKTKDKDFYVNKNKLSHITERIVNITFNDKSKTDNEGQNKKIFKVKRYFTEQKDYPDHIPERRNIKQKTSIEAQSQFLNNNIEIGKQKLNGIKIIKVKKTSFSREELVTGGKLYDQINNIYEAKTSPSGHLSLMKRNYNIKKLQKLLKAQQEKSIQENQ